MNPAHTRASGGCLPRCASSSRIANASGRFTLSAMAVAHPVGVIPTIRTPSHRKCAGHGSRHGLNSAICSPVCASRTSRRAPLRKSRGRRLMPDFPMSCFPPCDHRHDMVDMESRLLACLGEAAILTAIPCPVDHLPPQAGGMIIELCALRIHALRPHP